MPAELQALKQEAERRITEWATTGCGLVSSSLYEACAWFSTGLGDHHSHDAQIGFFACGYNDDIWRGACASTRTSTSTTRPSGWPADAREHDRARQPGATAQRGRDRAGERRPRGPPDIRMNYFADPHDLTVMVAVMRRVLDIVAHWPAHRTIGPLLIPPFLARKHGHVEGTVPSDALLEDLALHYSWTVYHPTTTCRIGSVVDPRLE